jgi:membrane protein
MPSGAAALGRWRTIAGATIRRSRVENVPLLAAGVAFYAMLALVPALGAAVSIYGLVATRAQVDHQIASLATTLPPEARQLVRAQLQTVTSSSSGGLGLALAVGLSVALWSASSGMRWLLTALTAAYGETETRGYVRLRLRALILTVGVIVALGVSLGILLALPSFFAHIGLAGLTRLGASVLRFPALAALMIFGLAVLYRYGPDHKGRRWQLITWGSCVAATIWVAGSIGLSLYATNASKFRAAGTYGALGAVVVLLLWLFLTSLAVIVGAVVNSEVAQEE